MIVDIRIMEKQNTINKKLDYETELLVITMEE